MFRDPVQDGLDLGIPEPPEHHEWADLAINMISDLAATGIPFEAYDLTLAGLPDPPDPNCWGSAFRVASQHGVIAPIDVVSSARKTRAGGLTRMWVGTSSKRPAKAAS